MPTPVPAVDVFNPLLQELRDQFESRVFPEEGIEVCEDLLVREYNFHFKLPYVRLLIENVLSGSWGLGKTQEEVAERLGIERSRLSDALRRGELSLDIYMRLKCCPTKPAGWEPDVERLYPEMDRSGFIGVARCLASLVPDRPDLAPDQLNELNYELLCEVFQRFVGWTIARVRADHSAASDLVNDVVGKAARNVVPTWYTGPEQKRTRLLIERLRADRAFAFDHLCRLQANWQDIFVVSYSQLELVRWSPE